MSNVSYNPIAYGRYLLDGGDMVRALVERCRHHGMAPFVSLRMNDVHLLENVGKKTPESIWVSRFNFVYYRMGRGSLSWLVREPPFHVLRKLLDRGSAIPGMGFADGS